MCKETDRAGAAIPVWAHGSPVAGGVQPVLKFVVGEGAGVSPRALAGLSHVRADNASVLAGARVSSCCPFTGVSVGALRPVVVPLVGTEENLHAIHHEAVRFEYVSLIVGHEGGSEVFWLPLINKKRFFGASRAQCFIFVAQIASLG
jgi:hypothetical protein